MLPLPLQVAAGLLEVPLRAVQGQGNLFLEFLHLAKVLADLILGIGQRLEELAVGAEPGAVLPVLLAARAVAGAGAGIQGLQGGGQADHGPRVDARALRAREDLGDGLGEFPGLVEHLRARVQLFLFTAHDPGLPSRSAASGGDGCADPAIRLMSRARQGMKRSMRRR